MILEAVVMVLLGTLALIIGIRLGRILVRKGATAKNLFKGKNAASLAFLGLYMALLMLALYLPQFQGLPLEWRISGMQITWTLMRVILLGFCGLAFVVSWHTARRQIIAVLLLGLVGLGGFTISEHYFLSPIYASLEDNLTANGIFRQTSDSSCAPAALANVLRRWQINATESSVARLAGTSRLGTSMAQLVKAAQDLGMDGLELSPNWTQIQRINRPGVISTWLYSDIGRKPHAVSLLAMSNEAAIVADPAFGKFYRVPREQFDRLWRNEYLPIFRPADVVLTPTQIADYLRQLGYLRPNSDVNSETMKAAIKQFQSTVGIPATGQTNRETVLLLSGPFLSTVPRLNVPLDSFPVANPERSATAS